MSCPSSVGAALAKRVDVDDGAEVVELVEMRGGRRLPHRAFRRFAVAHQHVGAVGRSDAPRVERAADADAQSLAERAGGDVHERQARRGMALEVRREQAQVGELLARNEPGLGPHRIQQRRRVALRHDQPIGLGDASGSSGSNRISAKNKAAIRSAADMHVRRMPAGRRRGRADRFHAKAGGDVLQ